jgi:hypothetical protein
MQTGASYLSVSLGDSDDACNPRDVHGVFDLIRTAKRRGRFGEDMWSNRLFTINGIHAQELHESDAVRLRSRMLQNDHQNATESLCARCMLIASRVSHSGTTSTNDSTMILVTSEHRFLFLLVLLEASGSPVIECALFNRVQTAGRGCRSLS